jgi:serralysin
VTSVTGVSPTGNPYIDGVLDGTKWAVNSLTFSFPTDPSLYGPNYGSGEPLIAYKAFTAVQQTAVQSILQMYSSVANVQFTQIAETPAQSATLRYAESNTPATAWSYYPSTSALGGDMWFNNSSHYYDNPIKGNYAYEILIHETGHAMGLKHPQDSMGSFGVMPADHDSVEYTVMSYRSYVGGPLTYTMASSSYPQTLMMNDIAALQTMYGANYTANSGDTVYRWDPSTGKEFIDGVAQAAPAGNKIFMTLWDGGGSDTYDFSNYTTNLKVDLNPGAWTTASATQLANLGSGHYAAGNIANALLFQGNTASLIENAVGGAGSDVISGNQGNNELTGGAGNDVLDGGAGTDVALYSGLSTDHLWTQNADGSWLIADLRLGGPDGSDTLKNIEELQFSDTLLALGVAAPANTAPTIASAAPSVSLTEWTDLSADEVANTQHTASGTISYTDPDATNVHVASFIAEADGYLGTFLLGSVDDTSDSVVWSFTVSDSALDYLTSGQTLTEKYDVTLDDGHGGTAYQTVTITLVGAVDAIATPTSGDSLIGGAGNDTLDGGTGADTMAGGTGNDIYYVDNAGDVVNESSGEGTDNVKTTLASFALPANVENLAYIGVGGFNGTGNALANTLTGGAGNDSLGGGDGNDTLIGGAGADTMAGGARGDLYFVDNVGDVVIEDSGKGTDTVKTTLASYVLPANVETLIHTGAGNFNGTGNALANTLTGGVGNDSLIAGDGNDILHGGAGADTLAGGNGADRLDGGAGYDIMTGGSGADHFVFGPSDLSTGPALGEITDFSHAHADKLDLSAIDAIVGGADDPFSFIGNTAFTGAAGQLHYVVNGSGGVNVEGDINGDGVADFSIAVDNTVSLVGTDFTL